MTFEVIRLGLANAGMLELQCVQLGGLRVCSPRKMLDFRPSKVVSDAIFE